MNSKIFSLFSVCICTFRFVPKNVRFVSVVVVIWYIFHEAFLKSNLKIVPRHFDQLKSVFWYSFRNISVSSPDLNCIQNFKRTSMQQIIEINSIVFIITKRCFSKVVFCLIQEKINVKFFFFRWNTPRLALFSIRKSLNKASWNSKHSRLLRLKFCPKNRVCVWLSKNGPQPLRRLHLTALSDIIVYFSGVYIFAFTPVFLKRSRFSVDDVLTCNFFVCFISQPIKSIRFR